MSRSQESNLRPTSAEISLKNLEHNALWLKSLNPHFFCPMLKANAYGHGDVEVAKQLSRIGIKTFGMALIEEGVKLRKHGFVKEEILVFGCFNQAGAKEIVKYKLTPVLSLMNEITALKKLLKKNANYPVHIKFNSGMARLGFELDQAEDVKRLVEKDHKLKIAGVCSHLSHGEDASLQGGKSQRQMQLIGGLKNIFGPEIKYHLFNSAAGLSLWAHNRTDEFHFGFRPGIALYGCLPDVILNSDRARKNWKEIPLKPVMSLRSGVVNYHRLNPGESVSYGGLWTAKRPSLVGVVPVGYADGFTRHFTNKGKMLFRGQRVLVAGRVCMDYTMVDLTDVLGTDFGDYAEEIVLIGQQGKDCLKAEEVAAWSDTISYEIVTCVGRRVPRKYVKAK